MKIIKNIILILAAVTYSNSFSQEVAAFETHNIFTLASGLSLNAIRDEMMSPLIYRGAPAPIEFSYRYRGSNSRHSISLNYNNSKLESSITSNSSHYIKNLNLSLEYSFAKKVTAFAEFNTTCFLGIRLSSFLNMRNYYFLKDKSHMSAEQMTGLGFQLLTETYIQNESNNFLRLEINIPFISYALLNGRYNANVSEKFNDLDFEQNILWQVFKKGDFITFNKLFKIEADISYNIFLSNHVGLDLQYRFLFYSFEQYNSLLRSKVLNNQFFVGMMVIL